MPHDHLEIEKLNDFSMLDDFYCGIAEFDDFIHNGDLEKNILLNLSSPYYVKENGKLVGFFSLACDSLILSNDYKDDFTSEKKILDDTFEENAEKFESRPYYPALDISFLAVKKECREQDYGTSIIERIIEYAQEISDNLGLLFVVVDAFHDSINNYSTIDFYTKCGFLACSELKGNTKRMYRPIF